MLKEILYNSYCTEKKHKGDNQEIKFAPSYFFDCARQIYYKKKRIEKTNKPTEANYLKMDMGNAVHEKIQAKLKEIGCYVEGEEFKEVEWNSLKWLYRIDGKVKDGKENNYIYELKSIYSTGFKQVKNNARPEHELQLLMYLTFENEERGIILYVGRDNGYVIEYNYTVSQLKEKYKNYISKRLVELKELKNKIENNILPVREYGISLKNYNGKILNDFTKDKIEYSSCWQCRYCQWYNLCWQKELEEIKNYKFFINNQFTECLNVHN